MPGSARGTYEQDRRHRRADVTGRERTAGSFRAIRRRSSGGSNRRCAPPPTATSPTGSPPAARASSATSRRAYNDLVERNAQLTAELVRLGRVVGREGRMTERARTAGASGGWETALSSVNGLVDDLVRPTTEVARVIVAVAEGDLTPEDGADDRRPAAQGRVRPHRHDGERDGRPARLLRRRGLARGARGRHRGQARRPGAGPRRRGHVEGPHGQRELHGLEPHGPGPQHRPGHDRGRQRRPVAEDHGGREGRGPRAQADDQRHGRPAALASPTRSRASRARSARRASSAARPRSATSPACGATSPRTSTSWRRT